MDVDIKELYRKRKTAFRQASKLYQECIDTLLKTKKEMIAKAVREATVQAEIEFKNKHGKDLEEAERLLKDSDIELRLLRCPDERHHEKSSDSYYKCETCNFVSDKAPWKHF